MEQRGTLSSPSRPVNPSPRLYASLIPPAQGPHRQVTVALWRGANGESEEDVPHYPTSHLPVGTPSSRTRSSGSLHRFARSPFPLDNPTLHETPSLTDTSKRAYWTRFSASATSQPLTSHAGSPTCISYTRRRSKT